MRIELIDVHVPDCTRWWNTDSVKLPDADAPVFEDRWYSIALYEYDRSLDYVVYIGDECLNLQSRQFSSSLEFERGVYFESASGATELCVKALSGNIQRAVFKVALYVVPSKIGWSNYKSMVLDLQCVCRALVSDIRGKSRNSRTETAVCGYRPLRTLDEELVAVCSAARQLRPLLHEIRTSPKSAMKLNYCYATASRCWSAKEMSDMMKRGLDPSKEHATRKCLVGRLVESRDIAEHRLLKAFLKLLLERVTNCRAGIAADVCRLESERKYRSRTSRVGELSLYETEDLPRIKRFRERDGEANDVQGWISAELQDVFWQDVGVSVFAPESTQFAENEYYLRAANIILRYLRDLSHWGGTFGSQFMAKKSSRMYEQWVLIQLVAAFDRSGVALASWDEILGRSIDKKFGFDFSRNTTFSADICDGWSVVIRYEPWIFSRDDIWKHPGETLCHFGPGNWSPDIVIELVLKKPMCSTVYAIALDAKYSRRPTREMRENVRKYAKIRTTAGLFGRRVARQVWLVYPGEEGRRKPFWFDDEAMSFSREIGVMYRDAKTSVEPMEQVIADMVVMPGGKNDAISDMSDVGVRPRQVFVDFAQGTMAYFRQLIDMQGEKEELQHDAR